MRYLSLFAGIGGIDLGLERAGMECVGQVEWDDWCRQILEKHWPDVPRWEDIHDFDEQAADSIEPVDLIAGGFPCQPVSTAGKRLAQDDPRWLWPEFFRVVRMVRPRYVLVENVPGLLTAGFGDVAADLAAAGYDFEWTRLSAAAVGAPHLRQRIFIVAYTRESGLSRVCSSRLGPGVGETRDEPSRSGAEITDREVADTDRFGLEEQRQPVTIRTRRELGTDGTERPGRHRGIRLDADAPAPDLGLAYGEYGEALVNADGPRRPNLPEGQTRQRVFGQGQRDHPAPSDTGPRFGEHWRTDPADGPQPRMGRVANGIPRRVDRLRGLGNAVVPQVAEVIGRMILASEE